MFQRSTATTSLLPTSGHDGPHVGGGSLNGAARRTRSILSKSSIVTVVWALASVGLIDWGWVYATWRAESSTFTCDHYMCKFQHKSGYIVELTSISRERLVRADMVRIKNEEIVSNYTKLKRATQKKLGHSYTIVYIEPDLKDVNGGRRHQNRQRHGHEELKKLGTRFSLEYYMARKRVLMIDKYARKEIHEVEFTDSKAWNAGGVWMMTLGFVSLAVYWWITSSLGWREWQSIKEEVRSCARWHKERLHTVREELRTSSVAPAVEDFINWGGRGYDDSVPVEVTEATLSGDRTT